MFDLINQLITIPNYFYLVVCSKRDLGNMITIEAGDINRDISRHPAFTVTCCDYCNAIKIRRNL